MLNSSTNDPSSEDAQSELPELARGVLELFTGAMASISFPDVDGAVLQRQTAQVLERRRALEAAKAALEVATSELALGLEELISLADRGLAYARIYSMAHPELPQLAVDVAQLNERIKASRPSGRDASAEGAPTGAKRGRKKAPRPELPFAEAEGAASELSENRTEAAAVVAQEAEEKQVIEVVEATPAIEVVADAPAAPAAAPGKRGRKKAAAPVESNGETVIERD